MSQHASHRGSGHWWAQRLTAIALIFLGLWFLISIQLLDDLQFAAVSAWLGTPLNSILMVLTYVTLVYHSLLGVQVVIEDYVHGSTISVLSLRLNILVHILLAGFGLYALLSIGFAV
jgi:succinate dehydrogenase / fumarate reductase membrane anchor subunit